MYNEFLLIIISISQYQYQYQCQYKKSPYCKLQIYTVCIPYNVYRIPYNYTVYGIRIIYCIWTWLSPQHKR